MQFSIHQTARPPIPGPAFLDILTRFDQGQPLAVLHSGHQQGFSVIAQKPLLTLSARHNDRTLHIRNDGLPVPPVLADSEPLLQQWSSAISSTHLHPHSPLTGWIGQISYDIGRTLERIPAHATDDLHWPLLHWRLFDEYFLFDHATQSWTLIATDWPGRSQSIELRLARMAHTITEALPHIPAPHIPPAILLESLPRETYLQHVQRIQNYIAAGDVFQVNYAQRWKLRIPARPIDIFRNLMLHSPSPYASLLVVDDKAAISASPELFLQRTDKHLTTRPIKGTRPRDLANLMHDEELRRELLHSEKDQAELAMIVDLLRNDLGRIASYGSVHVTTPREIEMHPTVWHGVATIEAELFTRKFADVSHRSADPRINTFAASWAAIIAALMPGGSITGAPKIRAMQIIEELEPTRRGLYCGAIGCISSSDDALTDRLTLTRATATLNIAIRTIQLVGENAYIHAGGGIVADSDPEKEYDETLHKAAAMFRALGLNSE